MVVACRLGGGGEGGRARQPFAETWHHRASRASRAAPLSSPPGISLLCPHPLASGAPAMPPLHARIPHANRGYFDAPRVVPSLPATLRSFTASAAQWLPR